MTARVPVAKTYKIYIDGKFPRTESGRYYKVVGRRGELAANACRASRKDLRDAVVAARCATGGWARRSAYNRGQILYRIAEMLEGRRSALPTTSEDIDQAIDRAVHYAGWTDKT